MPDPLKEPTAVGEGSAPADESSIQGVAPKVEPLSADATVVDPSPPANEVRQSADEPAEPFELVQPAPVDPSRATTKDEPVDPSRATTPDEPVESDEAEEPSAPDDPGEPKEPEEPTRTDDGEARERYHIRTEGDARVIVSGNAPNIRFCVQRGLTVDERTRKKYGAQTVFLDGVYSGPPFLNNEARHYSLDHHAGCVRAFTLSTCEQAVVMLLQGLPLSSGMWTLYVNDPDLDSMLAAWVLLNHVELLQDDKALLGEVMPVIRLEGVIDAHGTDRELLTGFPESFHAEIRARVDALMEEERSLKSDGAWPTIDFVRYAKSALSRIDESMLSADLLRELQRTQEDGRASLEGGRIGVLLESNEGIYAVEARLKERYGSALGVIILSMGSGRYTLRLVDAFLRRDLTAVYRALNKVDPEAISGGDSPNVWGGSGDIGGSPRATGTGLTRQQILDVIETVLGEQPPWYAKVWRFLRGLAGKQPPALPPAK